MRQLRRPHRDRRAAGQAIVELSLLLPVMLVLSFGVWTGASFISDRQVAGQAARAGARLGAELGNNGFVTGQSATGCQTTTWTQFPTPSGGTGQGTDPCTVDAQILTAVTTTASSLIDSGGITEVDIYRPCNPTNCTGSDTGGCNAGTTGGTYQTGDPVDVYTLVSGTLSRNGSPGYTLDLRTELHPSERVVGVRVVYTFKSPTPLLTFNQQTSESSVMCIAPQEGL